MMPTKKGNMFVVEHKEISTGRSNTASINIYDAGSLTLPDVDENEQQSLTFYHQLQGLKRAAHYRRFIPKGKLFRRDINFLKEVCSCEQNPVENPHLVRNILQFL